MKKSNHRDGVPATNAAGSSSTRTKELVLTAFLLAAQH